MSTEPSGDDGLDRRTFVKVSAGAGLSALSPGFDRLEGGSTTAEWSGFGVSGSTAPPAPKIEDLPNPSLDERAANFDHPGYPSREAYRDMAEQERRVQQQMGPLELREVNAVEYLGLDGGRPLNEALASADLEGMLLRFPAGEFPITDRIAITADRCGIVGAGDATVFRITEGTVCQLQFRTERGRFERFTIDQTAPGALASNLLKTGGAIEFRDVTQRGGIAQRALNESQSVIQVRAVGTSPDAYIRVENWRAMGGSNAGSHSWASRCAPPEQFVATGNGVPGFWVGSGSAPGSTVQIVNSEMRGWENGFYASKTPASVQVIGGRFVNNNNATIRIAGANSYANGATVYYNPDIWPEAMPGAYEPGEIQGINAVRSEGKGTQMAARLVNLDLQAYNVHSLDGFACGGMNGLIRIQGTVGAAEISNCRLTAQNTNETPYIVVNRPDGSGFYPAPPAPFDIQISNVEIRGERIDNTTIDIQGRPNSVVRDSCIRIPGASPADVDGARLLNVGYGRNCSDTQLPSGPVGAPGNISSLNFSVANGSYNGSAYAPLYSQQRSKKSGIVMAIITGVFVMVAALAGLAVLLVALAAVGAGAVAIISYIALDD